MRSEAEGPEPFSELRRRAEGLLKEKIAQSPSAAVSWQADDLLCSFHELSVHQIELEMQNEELQRALKEVDAGRERYSNFYDLSPVGFCSLSDQGLFLEANLTLARMLGIPRSELVGQSFSHYVLKIHLDVYSLHSMQLFETSHSQAYDIQMVNPEDGVFWAHLFGTNARDSHGLMVCRLVVSDITERKLAEKTLAASEAEARTMLQTTMDGVWLMDIAGRFKDVNDSACRMLGYSRDEMCNMGMSEIEANESLEDLGKPIERVNREGTDLFESIHRRKDGTYFPVEIAITNIPEQALTVACVRDISERKAHEMENLCMTAELEQRVKDRTAQLEAANQELEAFSYSVSHDLRAPLRSIDGFSQVLLEDYSNQVGDTGMHFLQRIRAGTQRMGHLIDDLLKLSKANRSELMASDCDLSRLWSRVAGDLAELNPERRVEVNIQPGMLVQADQYLFQVVLENLFGNAWKFTSKCRAPRIEMGEIVSPGGERTFFIRDNGAGFDMAFVDKLFNAFQRLHATSEFEGTGIGLAIVQRIIHRHRGRVWAKGEPEKGATFFFTIPE